MSKSLALACAKRHLGQKPPRASPVSGAPHLRQVVSFAIIAVLSRPIKYYTGKLPRKGQQKLVKSLQGLHGYMGSFHVQLWTRIGTINLHSAVRCPRFSVSSRFGHPKGWTPNTRFMENPDPLSSVNRDHEPRRVWSPGFSRLRSLRRTGPAKAGTPNKFMESLDPPLSVNRDREPRRVWSPGFSRLGSLR